MSATDIIPLSVSHAEKMAGLSVAAVLRSTAERIDGDVAYVSRSLLAERLGITVGRRPPSLTAGAELVPVQDVVAVKHGPGTELKKLLSLVGINATPTCSCNKRAKIMDTNGCDWCEQNLDMIVGWLREEATKRKLPFVDAAGRMLVKRAIKNARKHLASSKHGVTTVDKP